MTGTLSDGWSIYVIVDPRTSKEVNYKQANNSSILSSHFCAISLVRKLQLITTGCRSLPFTNHNAGKKGNNNPTKYPSSDPNTVKLTSKGDLSYFYKYLDEKSGKKGKPAARKKPQPRAPFSSNLNNEKQNTKSLAGDKTVKQVCFFLS